MRPAAPRRAGSTPPWSCLSLPLYQLRRRPERHVPFFWPLAPASHILRAISTPTSRDLLKAKLSHRKANLGCF